MTAQRASGAFWEYCDEAGCGKRFMPLKRKAGTVSVTKCAAHATKADVLPLTEDDSPSQRGFTPTHVERILKGESKSDWIASERTKAQAVRQTKGEAQTPKAQTPKAPKAQAPKAQRPKRKAV